MPSGNKKAGLPKGIITALVTPLIDGKKVNSDALRMLVDFQVRNGVSGFFILGTYGEGLSIDPSIRKAFAEEVVEYVGSRVPVINCISSTSIDVSMELARHSADIGIRHIALLPPLYYKVGVSELLRFYKEFDRLGLDMLIYNNPPKTGVDITPAIFKAISAETNNLVGIKDSTASIERVLELTSDLSEEYYVAIASDVMILEAFLYNADSHICGICNAVPELGNLLYKSIVRGDIAEAMRYKRAIWMLRRIARDLQVEGLSLVKAMLRIRGLDVGEPLPPIRALNEKELSMLKKALESVLDNIGIKLELY
ncbi:MAG: dihydrodipicolinate synthase family protein [Sulfolobales archaeon]